MSDIRLPIDRALALRTEGNDWPTVARRLYVETGRMWHATTVRQAVVRFTAGKLIGPPSPWTPERVAELKDMHARGLKPREIADAFGMQRNAVIGKLNRLGLSARLICTSDQPPKPKRQRPDRPARAAAAQPRLPRMVSPPLFLEEKEYVPGTGVTLEQLELHHCRWPLNTPAKGEQYFFCGETMAKNAPYWYCARHLHAATYSSARAAAAS